MVEIEEMIMDTILLIHPIIYFWVVQVNMLRQVVVAFPGPLTETPLILQQGKPT